MDLDTELNLAEAGTQLGTSVEKLIQWGAHGKLTISAVADDWPIRAENETIETISGLVALVPDDLLQSYGAEFTLVRKVVTVDEGEIVTLVEPIKLLRGVLYVTAEEFRRFLAKHGDAKDQLAGTPPYLNEGNAFYSEELDVAVDTWMTLFASGEFDRQGKAVKEHIYMHLAKKYRHLRAGAKERIATLVNPRKYKDGGPPPTPTKKT